MKLPPLNAVRAFEAAARHASFRLAAAELFVTPGAVSQQIRLLEDHLGVQLFERLPRHVRLTPAGQDFFAAVTRHLRGIAQASERLKPRADTVLLTVVPTFASRWLLPRLPHFTQLQPSVQVRVDATPALIDFAHEQFDLGIRYGRGGYPGLESHLLFSETVIPLCSPSYRAAHRAGAEGGLAWPAVRLLHENPPDDFWPQWISGIGFTDVDADAGMYFSHGLLVLSAAIEGQGVALQPREFVERELVSGALIVADDRKIETGRGFYLVWPRRELRPAVARFRDWVINEIESKAALAQLPAFVPRVAPIGERLPSS
ncbi:MAG: LysR substrate-binding domain-containing protein [Burkholderiaceae bacterium]